MYSEDSKKKLCYLLSDIVAIVTTYLILSQFYDYVFFGSKFLAVIFGFLIIISGILSDEYSSISKRGYLKELKFSFSYGVKILVLFSFVLMLGKVRFLSDISNISYFFLSQIVLLSSLLVYIGRITVKFMSKNQIVDIKNVLLLTNFTNDRYLEESLAKNQYQVIAYVSDKTDIKTNLPVLTGVSSIRDFIANNQVDEIFVDNDSRIKFFEETGYFRLLGIPTTVNISNYYDYYIGNSVIKKLGDLTFVTTAITIVKFRQLLLKRLIDITIASIGLLVTLIAAIIIAPIVKKQSPGPLIFTQKRVGKNGKIFDMYKFRSMYNDAEERKKELMVKNELGSNHMFKMNDDPRIFPFGHKLRDWSIDELPQFFNILKGDMSLVGTRPPTLDEYRDYEFHHFKRLTTKPGITGLWQVSGRSDITNFEDVVALDMEYIQNWSFSQDIKIIMKTFIVVFGRKGSR